MTETSLVLLDRKSLVHHQSQLRREVEESKRFEFESTSGHGSRHVARVRICFRKYCIIYSRSSLLIDNKRGPFPIC